MVKIENFYNKWILFLFGIATWLIIAFFFIYSLTLSSEGDMEKHSIMSPATLSRLYGIVFGFWISAIGSLIGFVRLLVSKMTMQSIIGLILCLAFFIPSILFLIIQKFF